jgi:hypothetical protein
MGKLLLEPRRTFVPSWFYSEKLEPASPPHPAGYRKLYQNRSWRVWRAPGC